MFVKRSIIYRITASVLACMVFLSTSMSSMSLHYCGGHFASVGFFDHDSVSSSCCALVARECEKSNGEEDCCTQEFIDLNWDTDIAIQVASVLDINIQLVAIIPSFSGSVTNSAQSTFTPQSYIPPLLKEDRAILFQQFLI